MLGPSNDNSQQGGALGGGFLPEDYVQRKAEGRANTIGLTLFCAVMGTVVAAFFVTNRSWKTVHEEREAIAVQYTAAEPEIELLIKLEERKEQMLQKAEIVTALIEPVPRSILMAELVTRMPEDMTLLTVELHGRRVADAAPTKEDDSRSKRSSARGRRAGSLGGTRTGASADEAETAKILPPRYQYSLTLNGVTPENGDIADYLDALKLSPLLRRVELHFAEPHKMNDIELRKFEITAEIDPRADARGIDPPDADSALANNGTPPTEGAAEDAGADQAAEDEAYATVNDAGEGQ
ncbi:MAG: PilN domain-containing protein [Phycisphaerales bacterium]|nr:PilN domain-containing protein [Phycisphaerales bacterium]